MQTQLINLAAIIFSHEGFLGLITIMSLSIAILALRQTK